MLKIPLIIILTTVLYGLIYSVMFKPKDFGFKSKLDPYYFSFTTMSSVGYGDFSPKTNAAKFMVMTQQTLLIIEYSAFIAAFMNKNLNNNLL
tara:strand:- start:3163 stop:3438 length:276 start_codon:yes stop_codon:yes gene_type:complete